MRKTLLKTIFVSVVLGWVLCRTVLTQTAPTPSPTPFDINKVDFSKITQADIDKTIAHRKELDRQGATINEKQAVIIETQATSLASASKNITELQGQIRDLAKHDREMTDKVSAQKTEIAEKKLALLRRDVIIGFLTIAVGVLLFLKYGKYLTLIGL